MDYVTLNNGVKMPKLGFGVYQTPPEDTERAVREALEVGYRHIDTAQLYRNEEGVGSAVAQSSLDRSELFITSKVWFYNEGYEAAKASIDESLKKLKTEYLDLMLIHQPFGDYYSTYRALQEAREAGKIRAIGVSNFSANRMIDLAHFTGIVPAVNQVETHVFFQQQENHEYMKKLGVQHESWGPFAEGENNFFTNETLTKIGEKYGKTAAQVGLRYLLQCDIVVIPKTVHKERMEQNIDVFDFELTQGDMDSIATLDTGKSLFMDHFAAETAERFIDFAL
ncbi:aldo/keto reductase [Alloscardovia venturai]|uniref:Aldo/keto reductase n=1 Tax=Alloscardovia venturai TaxID=1769421 RepID=A0ABW2Y7V7_9BIFI